MNAQATSKEIAVRLVIEGWGAKPGWEKVWDELVAPDVISHHVAFPAPILGLEAAKSSNARLFQGFPDLEQTIECIIAEDDKVALHHHLKGVHSGEFLGIPPTGKLIEGTGAMFFQVANGKIVERWYETNLLGLMQQLGVIPDSKMGR
jgi:steroid delta-isomerase-like uncharacterized protein